MRLPTRGLAALLLLLAPAGCDWCDQPGTWDIAARGVVHDARGNGLGELRVVAAGSGRLMESRALSLTIEMTGPPELAGVPEGWPAGGALQGWVDTVRVRDARGVELVRARPRRGAGRRVFEPIHLAVRDQPTHDALVRGLREGTLVLEATVLDDPVAPPLGAVRGTLAPGRAAQREGTCPTT